MAVKKTTYIIEVNTENGKIKIDGLTKGFVKAELAAKSLNKTLVQQNKNLGQGIDKTGLAGAAVVEMGRTISDANYGLTAMANNISQLSTLFTTLVVTSGGLTQGLKAMWSALMGPLGIIVVFQIAVAIMEKFAIEAKKSTAAVNDVAKAYRNAATELELQLKLDKTLTDSQRENIEERILLLKEEAKARAQIAKLQKLQGELVELEMKQLGDFIPWYQALWESVKSGDILKGGPLRSQGFITSMMGLGEENRAEQRKEIEDKMAELISGIDVDAIKRLTAEKGGAGKKGAKQKGLFLELFGLTGTDTPTTEEINSALTGMWAELKIKEEIRKEDLKNQEKFNKEQKKRDKEAFEHKMMLYDGIGQGLNALGYLMGEATQEGKAIAAAGALIDTYAAIVGILKNTARTPAGGIPGYAIAQAIGAGLFGFAQVKKIYSVKVPNSGGSSSSSEAAGDTSIQAPNFYIVGGSGINQLKEAIVGQLNKPNKVYITSKDIRTGAELDRNIRNGATVG